MNNNDFPPLPQQKNNKSPKLTLFSDDNNKICDNLLGIELQVSSDNNLSQVSSVDLQNNKTNNHTPKNNKIEYKAILLSKNNKILDEITKSNDENLNDEINNTNNVTLEAILKKMKLKYTSICFEKRFSYLLLEYSDAIYEYRNISHNEDHGTYLYEKPRMLSKITFLGKYLKKSSYNYCFENGLASNNNKICKIVDGGGGFKNIISNMEPANLFKLINDKKITNNHHALYVTINNNKFVLETETTGYYLFNDDRPKNDIDGFLQKKNGVYTMIVDISK